MGFGSPCRKAHRNSRASGRDSGRAIVRHDLHTRRIQSDHLREPCRLSVTTGSDRRDGDVRFEDVRLPCYEQKGGSRNVLDSDGSSLCVEAEQASAFHAVACQRGRAERIVRHVMLDCELRWSCLSENQWDEQNDESQDPQNWTEPNFSLAVFEPHFPFLHFEVRPV